MPVTSAAAFIDSMASRGQYCFSLAQAERSVAGSPMAVRAALRRLKHKGLVAEPARGFLVIVPPEYRRLHCLPAEQFVPQLMEYWKEAYYVALLSAAELHGAAHQRPQVFQIMLRRNRRPVACGDVRVEFIAREDMDDTPVVARNTSRGVLAVATPEATAFELVGYHNRCGGLNNVATVLTELGERIDRRALKVEAKRSPTAWIQRLGYLLELVGREDLAAVLQPFVGHVVEESPLVRSGPRRGAARNRRWKLTLNASVEPDL